MSQYKSFFVQILKVGFLGSLAILILAGGLYFAGYKSNNALAVSSGESGSTDLSGYAWSENIGWISFNRTDTGAPYGVGIKNFDVGGGSSIGKLSGHAWSENIGWISFNRTDTGAPPSLAGYDPGNTYNVLAYLDANNKLQGWARALSPCDDNGDGDCADADEDNASVNAGGWDGWIALGDNNTGTGGSFGVSFNSLIKQFNGFAWGSDVVGWISFNCSNQSACGQADYKVATDFKINNPPSVPGGGGAGGNPDTLNVVANYCSGYLDFSWQFSDPDGDQQSKYKIDISNPNYSTGEVASSAVNSIVSLSNLPGWYGKTMNWTVTVWDNFNPPKSATSIVKSFEPMPNREYPYVAFYSNPELNKILSKQLVQFSPDNFSATDKTKCYSAGNTEITCFSWSWSFSGANPSIASSTEKEPTVSFDSIGSATVSLLVSDRESGGYSCTATKNINIELPLPEFKETK